MAFSIYTLFIIQMIPIKNVLHLGTSLRNFLKTIIFERSLQAETKTTDYIRVEMLLHSQFFFVTIMWFINLLLCAFRDIYAVPRNLGGTIMWKEGTIGIPPPGGKIMSFTFG